MCHFLGHGAAPPMIAHGLAVKSRLFHFFFIFYLEMSVHPSRHSSHENYVVIYTLTHITYSFLLEGETRDFFGKYEMRHIIM